MDKKKLEFIKEVKELTAFPDISLDLMSLLNESSPNMELIKEKVNLDQALVMLLLKTCKSPLYGIKQDVTTINQAIDLLGFNRLRSALLCYFIRHLYTFTSKDKIKNLLWYHSIAVAVFSKALCSLFNLPPEKGYVAGLIHDIGKLILYLYNEYKYREIIDQMSTGDLAYNSIDLENKMFGFSHTECGAYLLEIWGLDEKLRETVYHHHDKKYYLNDNQIVGVVSFANQLVHKVVEKKEINVKSFLEKYSVSISEVIDFSKTTLQDLSTYLSNLSE